VNVIRENRNGLYSYPATLACITDCVGHMIDIPQRYVGLSSPRMPRDMRVESNGFVQLGLSQRTLQGLLTPGRWPGVYNLCH
jgi:hypothetical protein